MKKQTSFLIAALALFTAASCAGTRTIGGSTVDESRACVGRAAAGRDFTIDITTAISARGMPIFLTTAYSLTVRGDSVYSCLPFFGEMYRAPFGENLGLNFNGILENYRVGNGRREQILVSFEAKAPDNDRHRYTVEIDAGGGASLRVLSDMRSMMEFEGEIRQE